MKKLVLVLGLATLFSCEKEQENKVCDCVLTWEQKMNINGGTYDPVKDVNEQFYWRTVKTYPKQKDFCANGNIIEYYNDSVDVQRYICK